MRGSAGAFVDHGLALANCLVRDGVFDDTLGALISLAELRRAQGSDRALDLLQALSRLRDTRAAFEDLRRMQAAPAPPASPSPGG